MAHSKKHMLVALAAGVLLLAAWPSLKAQDPQKDDALRQRILALNDVTGDDPIKGEIRTLVEDREGTKKLLAEAVKMAKEKDQPLNYNAARILATTALILRDLDASRILYQVCADQATKLRSVSKLAESYYGMLDVITSLNLDKKFDQAAKLSQEFLETLERQGVSPTFKERVLRSMIQAMAGKGETDKAKKMVDNLVKERGTEWRNWKLKASLAHESGDHEEAAKVYEDVLKRIAEDKKLDQDEQAQEKLQIHYALSAVYVDLNQIQKAADHLKALLKQFPDHPTFNNDLGYIWADNDQNLDEAERMIRKALDEDRKLRKAQGALKPEDDKDNPAYLDSMGWVLFKKKKYDEAKKYLIEASQHKDGQHIEILDHLGDTHMVLGEKDQAIAIWKKALQIKPANKREEQKKISVEKKLKANQ